MKLNYKHTTVSCFLGCICQAIIVNFPPLLFLTFSENYGISTEQLSAIILANFGMQLLTDLLASKYADRIGVRTCLVAAHTLAATGLVLLTFLPDLTGGFLGLVIATAVYGLGGGLLEALVSPVLESCPSDNRSGIMSIMHSFYCWGVVFSVLVSTAFFLLFGIGNWRIITLILAVVPFFNAVAFLFVPINREREQSGENGGQFIKTPVFFIFFVIMLASGAAEVAISQWASAFAEAALGVEKAFGDIIGVCGFAATMGIARALYGAFSKKISIRTALIFSGALCFVGYLIISLSPNTTLSLVGCALTGFAVGILWPGTLSYAGSCIKGSLTKAFGLLAFAGDIGCTTGPFLVGSISAAAGGNMKLGFLVASVFPIVLILAIAFLKPSKNREK